MTIQTDCAFDLNSSFCWNGIVISGVPGPLVLADGLRTDSQRTGKRRSVASGGNGETNRVLGVHGRQYRTVSAKFARTENSHGFTDALAMDAKQEFSNRLNSALDAIGYAPKGKGRQVQLSKDMGVSQKGARKWLEAEALPGMENLAALAVFCRVGSEWLLTGRGQREIVQPPSQDPEIAQWAQRMECLPSGDRQKIFQVIEVFAAPVLPKKAA
jgi:hypothetical protein